MDPISVSAVNTYVKALLESDRKLLNIMVTGEVSGISVNSISGHMYFVLKDKTASIKIACFKTYAQRLPFVPKDGMKVIVQGKISLFERDGQYQLIASDMHPDGEGEINKVLEALKAKLSSEGLFDESRKIKLIRYPKIIALVTAKGSAALADILNVISRRYPLVKIIVFPVFVQGTEAEKSIVSAINEINMIDDIDTVIVARGGGSKEDLFIFNSESIARAVSKLRHPMISAVGHETDVSIIDMVADVRAATPSAAAEIAVPDIGAELMKIYSSRRYIAAAIDRYTENAKLRISESYESLYRSIDITLTGYTTNLFNIYTDTAQLVDSKLSSEKKRVYDFTKSLNALSPLNVLDRGYIYTTRNNQQISSIKEINLDEELILVFKDGYVSCTVKGIEERE